MTAAVQDASRNPAPSVHRAALANAYVGRVCGAPGHLLAGWPRPARSLRFHVFKQVVGVDPDFVFARTTTETQADLNTFVSGQHVRVSLTAVNTASEGLPCAPVEHVVP